MGREESGTLARLGHLIADRSSQILESGSGCIARFSHCPRAPSTRPSPTPDERALLTGYNQRRGNRMSVNRLPPVGRIRAVHLPEGGPRVPKSLTIEYSDRSNASKWYQLEVPFVDAMHLLALLQGAKDDVGYKEPVESTPPTRAALLAGLDGYLVEGTRKGPSR
jgi:hypothetical protein